MGKFDRAEKLGDQDAMLRFRPAIAAVIARPLRARNGFLFGFELQRLPVQPLHLIDRLDHLARALENLLFRQLIIVKDDYLFNGDFVLAQFLP